MGRDDTPLLPSLWGTAPGAGDQQALGVRRLRLSLLPVLLTQRARDPQQGFLDFPGGFVDPEETLEAAAVRELEEELGLAIDGDALRYRFSLWNRYPYAGVTYPTSDVYFELTLPARPVLRCADDVAGAYWFPHPGAIPREQLAFPAVVDAVERLCR
ncbi:MAG: NUDIX domain-containing protein [Gammaproteobacteria bacterium]|nr:NUDIX domain-containing protein [Gammaproteobacteria bacterium]